MALVLTPEEALTFSFDFSSQTLGPPWDDFDFHFDATTISEQGNTVVSGSLPTYGVTSVDWGPPDFAPPQSLNVGISAVGTWLEIAFTVTPTAENVPGFGNTIADVDLATVQARMGCCGASIGSGSFTPFHSGTIVSAPVHEPSTLLLLGSGLVGLVGFGRKKFKR